MFENAQTKQLIYSPTSNFILSFIYKNIYSYIEKGDILNH